MKSGGCTRATAAAAQLEPALELSNKQCELSREKSERCSHLYKASRIREREKKKKKQERKSAASKQVARNEQCLCFIAASLAMVATRGRH